MTYVDTHGAGRALHVMKTRSAVTVWTVCGRSYDAAAVELKDHPSTANVCRRCKPS